MVDNKLSLPVVPSRAANPHLSRHFNRKTVNISMGPGCSFGEAKQIEEPANILNIYCWNNLTGAHSCWSTYCTCHVNRTWYWKDWNPHFWLYNIARKFQFFDLSRSSTCLSKTTEISWSLPLTYVNHGMGVRSSWPWSPGAPGSRLLAAVLYQLSLTPTQSQLSVLRHCVQHSVGLGTFMCHTLVTELRTFTNLS